MNKQEKIAFINSTNARFENAENHGNGNNWWYPKENRIAYNVKMRRFPDVESMRKHMSEFQNEYYTDKQLIDLLEEEREQTANMLVDDIKEQFKLESGYAGRSGGWIEVDFINTLEDIDEEEEDEAYIEDIYLEAVKLSELEANVEAFISEAHKNYNSYVDTEAFYKDIIEYSLQSDEDIKHIMIENMTLAEMILHKNEQVRRHANGIKKQLLK